MKLFLTQYCNKYPTAGPTFKTDGFGFVFPRGSPLVADLNRAILNIMEGDKITEIENAWFQKQTSRPDSGTTVSSNSLSVGSFWGLFHIAGLAALLALIIFAAKFLYNQRDVLLDSKTPVWDRIVKCQETSTR
ncbi:hypothetical protein SLE2022_185120 [Rubroshorea leprosula]